MNQVLLADLLDVPLALAPHFSVHPLPKGTHLLVSEERSVKLNDPLYAVILPHLDGWLTGREIIERASGSGAGRDGLAAVLHRMIDRRYVVQVDPIADTGRTALRSAAGLSPAAADRTMRDFKVAVMSVSRDGAAGSGASTDLLAMLAGEGFAVADAPASRLVVVTVDDYLQPALEPLARRFAADKQAWLPFKPGGLQPLLGPVIAPFRDDGACYHCLARRIGEHRPGDRAVKAPPQGIRPAKAWTRASLALAQSQAVLELVDYALDRSSDLDSSIAALSGHAGTRRLHTAPRLPDCTECGREERVADAPVRIADHLAIADVEAGWRVLSPQAALTALERVVSPITGIVSQISPMPVGPGLHVYTAAQGARVPIDPRQNRTLGRAGGAAGKGLTDIQAKISCLAEAVERYASQWTGSEVRRLAAWSDIAADAPDPAHLLGFSEYQYAHRQRLNVNSGQMSMIPERFRPDATIEWSPAWSLRDDARRWLPTRYCYYEYGNPDVPGDHPFCWADSNGCASGGSLEEAILQGFLELVERDAVALWWYNRVQRPAIDPAGLDPAFVRDVTRFFDGRGRDFHLLDLTTDLGIPVVAAVTATRDGRRILLGFGSHFDGRIAAHRALSEVIQVIPFDDTTDRQAAATVDHELWNWLDNETVAGNPYLYPSGTPRAVAGPPAEIGNMSEAVHQCVRIAASRGHDLIVQNLSRSDLPVHCVRVVVPGLRHFWNRRAPGRLYDVPAALGWMPGPLPESALNPINFFL